MAPTVSWRCCFRPQVAEGNRADEQIVKQAGKGAGDVEQDKCTEDSANAELFSRLQCRPVRTHDDNDVESCEEYASPASSYQTCFSEQDPLDLPDFSRYHTKTYAIAYLQYYLKQGVIGGMIAVFR
jgi:hypothetical protein